MISVVVVNWNGADIIKTTIDSLIQSLGDIGGSEIIVVDNASKDKSIQILRSYGNQINLIESNFNLGFAGGCNLGALGVLSPYILFLNPDTEVNHIALNSVIKFMQSGENISIGILGLKLVDEFGQITRSCARFPQAYMFLSQSLGIDRLFPKTGHTMKEWDHMESRIVDQVIGAFFLVRTKLFKQLGGFDKQFFVYFEEVDFARRAYDLGFKSIYYAEESIIHSGQGTTNQIKARRLYYSVNSRILYGQKHYRNLNQLLNLTTALVIEPLSRVIFTLITGNSSGAKEILQAYRMIYADLPSTLSSIKR